MKNVYNAMSDVVGMYKFSLDYTVIEYNPEDNLWIVNVYNNNAPGSFLQIEIIDDFGIPKCCVLQNVKVRRSSMFKFMNRLVNALDD